MEQQIVQIGALSENCYCVAGQTGAVILDPGAPDEAIRAFCRAHASKEIVILLTHAHFDHIGGVAELVRDFHLPVWIGEREAAFLNDETVNLSARFRKPVPPLPVDRKMTDGETVNVGDISVCVSLTPGHTAGSVCYRIGGDVYTGDTLFASSFGRTDFPGGDAQTLRRSLDELLTWPPEWRVFPGHGEPTTIGREQAGNPYRGYLV